MHFPVLLVWSILALFWLAASIARKPNARKQSRKSRIVQGSLVLGGFLLVFHPWIAVGPLALRLLPESAAVRYLGFALTVGGAAFAIWARLILGRNWSGIAAVKQGHELVQKGPYALVRHPIYSGFLVALAGSAIALGELRGLLGLMLVCAAFWMKVRTEEAFMLQQFGDRYKDYQRTVKAGIPMSR